MGSSDSDSRRHILVAGGGFAALEATLALRHLLGEHARITLLAPEPRLAYRPAATCEVFSEDSTSATASPPHSYDLRAIAEDLGVTLRRDRLEAVAAKDHSVRLASFAHLRYDLLILALGARATAAIPGALTFRDQRDVPQLRRLLADVHAGRVGHLLFAVPSGCTWPLALYELALMTAASARRHGVRMDISLITPEGTPLKLFGPDASALVAGVLEDRGVRFRGSSIAASIAADGALKLHFNGAIKADRTVTAPQLRGPRITGLPSDWWGFLPTNAHGSVEGLADVYAAGDMTAFPVKQGGLAAQQADLIAYHIAAEQGLATGSPVGSPERVLSARLLGGREPLFLHVALDERGHALRSSLRFEPPSAEPSDTAKVFGRHLTSYLEDREPLVAA